MTHLTLSLTLSVTVSDDDVPEIKTAMKEDLEYLLEDRECKVNAVSIEAATFPRTHHQQETAEPLTLSANSRVPFLSLEVSRVCEEFNLVLPRPRKGGGAWRSIVPPLQGEVHGLPGCCGKLVLTDGIVAILVKHDCIRPNGVQPWMVVHLDSFEPLDDEWPSDLPKPAPRERSLPVDVGGF